jgi:micrococcal nuclease
MSARAFAVVLLILLLVVASAGASIAIPGRVLIPLALVPRPGWCELAYPTICVPSPPPDLDCPEIPFQNFQVLPPDPHGFDADDDGLGCESP